ncbi:MAG TPA: hypothetical protein VF487_03510 [Chitinophagaceae bacterium]
MSFKSIIGTVLIIAVIVALFTKPGLDDFKSYIRTKSPLPPTIEYTNGFAFSVFKVSYFDLKSIPSRKAGSAEVAVAIPKEKATYLALYGRFWKL